MWHKGSSPSIVLIMDGDILFRGTKSVPQIGNLTPMVKTGKMVLTPRKLLAMVLVDFTLHFMKQRENVAQHYYL